MKIKTIMTEEEREEKLRELRDIQPTPIDCGTPKRKDGKEPKGVSKDVMWQFLNCGD